MHSFKKFKVARRLGVALFDKCQTGKFNLTKTVQIGRKGGNRKLTDYGTQLLEKQKVRYYYNVGEKQFRNYVNKATVALVPARALFELLEKRLDNTVYRLGFAPTRQAARQMVSHGHVTVNGRKVDIPSFSVSENDVLAFREGSKTSRLYETAKAKTATHSPSAWLKIDAHAMQATVIGTPSDPDPILQFSSVIEFYSR
jgi:small subunit ribosomal protein S4